MSELNPRVVLWLKAVKLTPADIVPLPGTANEVRRVKVPDEEGEVMWTIAYSEWIRRKWIKWGTALGFKRDGFGNLPHEVAFANGHTAKQFEVWLSEQIK